MNRASQRSGTHVDVVDHVAGADLRSLLQCGTFTRSANGSCASQPRETDGVEGDSDGAALGDCGDATSAAPSSASGARAGSRVTALRVLSMTDWWYSYEPCEKFMRTAGAHGDDCQSSMLIRPRIAAGVQRTDVDTSSAELGDHLRRVSLGTWKEAAAEVSGDARDAARRALRTDGRDDRGLWTWQRSQQACTGAQERARGRGQCICLESAPLPSPVPGDGPA